jgi:hypothetical protein
MSQKVIYTSVKTALTEVEQVKHVGMWNNDFDKEEKRDVYKLPATFIELLPQNFRDMAQTGCQDYDMIIRIHVGFEDYTAPELVYDLKQLVHKKLQHLRCLDNTDELEYPVSKLVRIDERQIFDFDNLIVFEIDYLVKVRDLSTDKRITQDMSTYTPVLTPTIVTVIT